MKLLPVVACLVFGLAGHVRGADPAKPLASVLQQLVDEHLVAGAVVLVADKDRVLEVSAAGEADMVTHQPMPENAVFWIASMSKSLT
ncbi:MAG TPA: serine hydrolase, partial [Pirellulales bacterium]